jgi:hypothetical protein
MAASCRSPNSADRSAWSASASVASRRLGEPRDMRSHPDRRNQRQQQSQFDRHVAALLSIGMLCAHAAKRLIPPEQDLFQRESSGFRAISSRCSRPIVPAVARPEFRTPIRRDSEPTPRFPSGPGVGASSGHAIAFSRGGGPRGLLVFTVPKQKGAERRKALERIRRSRWPSSRMGQPADRHGFPVNDAHRGALRRSTAVLFGPGPRFRGFPISELLAGGRSAPGRNPGTVRAPG